MQPATISERLAELCARQGNGDQPSDVVHAAKRCLVDWFAATIPGAFERQAQTLEDGLADELDHGKSWTISGRRAPIRIAALINGVASHTVEFDDIFAPAIYHPGSPVIATSFAAAAGLGRSGRDLLNAIISGYEVSTRVGSALGRAHYRYWHSTGTAGVIGAAAAASLLHGLNVEQTAHALSTAATMAAGLQAAFRGGESEIKPLHAGHAADAGYLAASLAKGKIAANKGIFESDIGFGRVMAGEVDWDEHLSNMDSFNISRITVKNHGCCGHIFAALDGALSLRKKYLFSTEEIESIEIGGYQAMMDVTGNYDVDKPSAARFSLPFIVASGLIHGRIGLRAFDMSRLADPKVHELMYKIILSIDAEVDGLFPQQRSAKVNIYLKNGTLLKHFQPHRIGDPELPISDEELNQKFLELSVPVFRRKRSHDLLDYILSIEESVDIATMYPFFIPE